MTKSLSKTNLLDATYKYNSMWPSTRKLFHAGLIPMYTWTDTIFLSHKKIAKETGLGITQIKKCIKQAIELGVLKVKKDPKRRTLTYEAEANFVELCILIDACHFKMNWKKHSESVIKDVSEDELFFAKLLKKRGQLSTTKVSTSLLAKVSTIRILSSLTKSSLITTRDQEPLAGREQVVNNAKENPNPIKAGSPYLWGLKLKEKDRVVLTFRNSPAELKRAREGYDFLKYKKDVVPTNDAALLIHILKKNRCNKNLY